MLFYSNMEANEYVMHEGKTIAFVDGKYETTDKKEISTLVKAGYRSDGDGKTEQGDTEGQETQKEQKEAEALSEVKFDELRKMASEKGIKGYGKMKREELIEALGGE